MPICFICCGIMLIFMLFRVINSNFFNSKLNYSIMILYLVTQIFSFFIKDVTIFNISSVYFVPLLFSVLIYLVNIHKINVIKMLTISVLIATILLAIGFIDNAFIDFIENHLFEVCLVVSIAATIFANNVNENFITITLGFAFFVFGIIFKQSATIDLTNVTVLNCITFAILISIILITIKLMCIKVVRRLFNAKVKKI